LLDDKILIDCHGTLSRLVGLVIVI